MNDATVSWKKSMTGVPTAYSVVWTYNNAAQPAVLVPATSQGDSNGYSLDFVTSNPTITVKGGDVIGATVQALDSSGKYLPSGVIASTPPTVVEPTVPVPLGDPQNVTLVLA